MIGQERQEVHSESAPRVIKKTAELSIQVIAEHTDGAEIEMHEVFSDFENLILGDEILGDLVSRIMPDSVEFGAYMQAERPIISGKLKCEAIYYESMVREKILPDLEINSEIKLTDIHQ